MPTTLTIDPVTRIEGHLAIHVEIETDRIVSARVSGEMFRGFEAILKGRSPLDAQQITQRICGVCPVSHGIASSLAQEEAYGLAVPFNGRFARNLLHAVDFIHSHIFHFYRMSLPDFVDVTAVRDYRGGDPDLGAMRAARATGENAETPAETPAEAPASAPSGSLRLRADYPQDPEFHLPLLKHATEALAIRALAHQAGALFAGKLPHAASIVPGGITEKVTTEKILAFRSLLRRISAFIDSCYLPDAVALARQYPACFGEGAGSVNFLACGAFADPSDGSSWLFPAGVLSNGELRPFDPNKISEDVRYSRYAAPSEPSPARGLTVPAPGKEGAYSWIKAPRYGGEVVEVGPLARLLVSVRKDPRGDASRLAGTVLETLGLPPESLVSVMGRHLARAMECKVLAERCVAWVDALRPEAPCCTGSKVPAVCAGAGFTEAPRGALAHWIAIKDGRIATYECVVPTTWNGSPRDDKGVPGPIERALEGTGIADLEHPVEAVRVVRSFDPCIACAVH